MGRALIFFFLAVLAGCDCDPVEGRGAVQVREYTRTDGTVVRAHTRESPSSGGSVSSRPYRSTRSVYDPSAYFQTVPILSGHAAPADPPMDPSARYSPGVIHPLGVDCLKCGKRVTSTQCNLCPTCFPGSRYEDWIGE